jgi:hypothetical protein
LLRVHGVMSLVGRTDPLKFGWWCCLGSSRNILMRDDSVSWLSPNQTLGQGGISHLESPPIPKNQILP